ncbi:MAG: Transcriptional regulatory protein ZraR [Pelotomaculum sp. PtaU1.Bin035]|nr:MAG: Transcriptional regulatory protein ZraR [Pelotomaculum sp. PtaU1.Bin035]
MNILLVDDDHAGRAYLGEFLREIGHIVLESADGYAALDAFLSKEFHLVLSDIRMPKMSGIELLQKIRGLPGGQSVDIILITGDGELQTAIDALRAGAYDYLLKPINIEELVKVTERVAEHQALKRENEALTGRFVDVVKAVTEETRQELSRFKKAYYESVGLGQIGVFSEAMKKVIQLAQKLRTDSSVPVLIQGETGTGKEVVARYIHYGEGVAAAPFIDINCAAISPGIFESELFGYEAGAFTGGLAKGQKGKLDIAMGGTLFLDEIGEIPTDLQAKLLRVIQEKEFYRVGGLKKIKTDTRIICATNIEIEEKVRQGKFRRDLYYRLNVGRVYLPPLRQRTEDILPLARMFLTRFTREKGKRFEGIGEKAANVLLSYQWPGNVRELKNAMEWVVLMWDDVEVKPAHLGIIQRAGTCIVPGKAAEAGILDHKNFTLPPDSLPLEEYTNNIILKALRMHRGNKTETAKYLGISRRSLYSRLKYLMPGG